MSTHTQQIPADLVAKYDRPGPRYTSYPTAPQWREDFSADEYRDALACGSDRGDEPFALYAHIPFCEERCHYCGCNVVISKKPEIVDAFLDHLERELNTVADCLGSRRKLVQLHWGGGTPTYLAPPQIVRLHEAIARQFDIAPGTEVALEVDPRVTSHEQIDTLRGLGFNRISMGVQDLDPAVQAAIGRNQSLEETRELYNYCRDRGFTGINFDLIYGLPTQTDASWRQTIDTVIQLAPDRLAVYSYAHLPERLKHQAKMDAAMLPDAETKSRLINAARQRFVEAGYHPIGMDHFAKPGDELATASKDGRLHRNFMGYTTIADTQMLGIGPSAISYVGHAYAQNEKRLAKYYRLLEQEGFATTTGMLLNEDDLIRRWTIEAIMCNAHVSYADFAKRHGIAFNNYFAEALDALTDLETDGLIDNTQDALTVTEPGRLFLRNIAMVFDAYLKRPHREIQYSRTV